VKLDVLAQALGVHSLFTGQSCRGCRNVMVAFAGRACRWFLLE
jgi:hypothetical protein